MTRALPKAVQDVVGGGAESVAELILINRIRQRGLPQPQTQVQLIPGRRFRFDVVFPDWLVAVEVQGGQYVRGRHNRAAGFESDCIKSILAQLRGYLVLAVTPHLIDNDVAVGLIEDALRMRGWSG